MPDFTADEDIQGSNMAPEEETKPQVKVEEESIEIRHEVKVEVKTEEDVGPAGAGEQDSQETEQQPEQDAADQAEQVKAEGDRGGNYSRKRPYEESRGYSYYEHREEKRSGDVAKHREATKARVQKHREKIQSDPDLVEEYRRKERERYKNRKEKGLLKSVGERSAEQQKEQRAKWNENSKRYKKKKKCLQAILDDSPPSDVSGIDAQPMESAGGNRFYTRSTRIPGNHKVWYFKENILDLIPGPMPTPSSARHFSVAEEIWAKHE